MSPYRVLAVLLSQPHSNHRDVFLLSACSAAVTASRTLLLRGNITTHSFHSVFLLSCSSRQQDASVVTAHTIYLSMCISTHVAHAPSFSPPAQPLPVHVCIYVCHARAVVLTACTTSSLLPPEQQPGCGSFSRGGPSLRTPSTSPCPSTRRSTVATSASRCTLVSR
jgi:hypothetical protein